MNFCFWRRNKKRVETSVYADYSVENKNTRPLIRAGHKLRRIYSQQSRCLQLYQGTLLIDCSERIHNLSPQIQSISLANFILATNNSVYCKPMKRFPPWSKTGAFSGLRQVSDFFQHNHIAFIRLFYCSAVKKSMLINSQRCFPLLTNVYKEGFKTKETRLKLTCL